MAHTLHTERLPGGEVRLAGRVVVERGKLLGVAVETFEGDAASDESAWPTASTAYSKPQARALRDYLNRLPLDEAA